jgi:hypothetical protein
VSGIGDYLASLVDYLDVNGTLVWDALQQHVVLALVPVVIALVLSLAAAAPAVAAAASWAVPAMRSTSAAAPAARLGSPGKAGSSTREGVSV